MAPGTGIFRKNKRGFFRAVRNKKSVLPFSQRLPFDLYIATELNSGVLISAGTPGRGFAAAETGVLKTNMNKLAPDLALAAFNAWPVVIDRYFCEADPL